MSPPSRKPRRRGGEHEVHERESDGTWTRRSPIDVPVDSSGDPTGGDGAPLHLGDIQADDALIDALGSGSLQVTDEMATSSDVDDRLAAMLATWVATVQEPARPPAAFDPDAVIAAARAADEGVDGADGVTSATPSGGPPRRGHSPYVVRLSAAAVVALVVLGGVAVGNAGTARPGDVTWPIARVVFPEHARSVEAADTIVVHLDRARTALREGRTADAAHEVNEIQSVIGAVLPADGRATLDAEHTSIVAVIAATPAAVPTTTLS
jgi:hypothetical protein